MILGLILAYLFGMFVFIMILKRMGSRYNLVGSPVVGSLFWPITYLYIIYQIVEVDMHNFDNKLYAWLNKKEN